MTRRLCPLHRDRSAAKVGFEPDATLGAPLSLGPPHFRNGHLNCQIAGRIKVRELVWGGDWCQSLSLLAIHPAAHGPHFGLLPSKADTTAAKGAASGSHRNRDIKSQVNSSLLAIG